MELIVKTESCEASSMNLRRHFRGDMRPDAEDDRMTLEDMEEIPNMSITERDRESPAFITVENDKGVIEHVQVRVCCHCHVKQSSKSLHLPPSFAKYILYYYIKVSDTFIFSNPILIFTSFGMEASILE